MFAHHCGGFIEPPGAGVDAAWLTRGGVMVSNINASGGGTLVRVSTCYGETTALYEEWIVD